MKNSKKKQGTVLMLPDGGVLETMLDVAAALVPGGPLLKLALEKLTYEELMGEADRRLEADERATYPGGRSAMEILHEIKPLETPGGRREMITRSAHVFLNGVWIPVKDFKLTVTPDPLLTTEDAEATVPHHDELDVPVIPPEPLQVMDDDTLWRELGWREKHDTRDEYLLLDVDTRDIQAELESRRRSATGVWRDGILGRVAELRDLRDATTARITQDADEPHHYSVVDEEGPELVAHDMVNHPPHYGQHPSGVECITVTEHMNFNVGNAVKYLWRSDHKNGLEDLRKAAWYVNREINRQQGTEES